MRLAGTVLARRYFTLTTSPAEFVLLEQILPDGEDHPFASTMLNHFQKLNTPLKSVRTYPTVGDQYTRFRARGWDSVRVWTLWQAWADETFLAAPDRRRLDEIEPFDEWEEFALFASHYCVVHARARSDAAAIPAPSLPRTAQLPSQPAALQCDACPGQKGQRRFAAAVRLSSREGTQPPLLLNVLGLGTKSRLQSCDVFSSTGTPSAGEGTFALREGGPVARMCHSFTDLGSAGVLLAGGRGSPSSPLRDCWLFDTALRRWKRTHDLPTPLYRHSVTALGKSNMALLVGGRGDTAPFDGCLLYHPEAGWVDCEIVGDRPVAVYGAALCCGSAEDAAHYSGIYAGGQRDGLIADQILTWKADISNREVRCYGAPSFITGE